MSIYFRTRVIISKNTNSFNIDKKFILRKYLQVLIQTTYSDMIYFYYVETSRVNPSFSCKYALNVHMLA